MVSPSTMSPANVEHSCFAREVATRGWAVTSPVLTSDVVAALRADMASIAGANRGGARNLLELASVRALACDPRVRGLAAAVLGPECFAVRALFFDKTAAANWKVVWHQDLTVTAARRKEVPGYGPWTEKAGVPHVQPPVSVLEGMLAIRVHLDACTTDNGPVRVLEGTHTSGRLSSEQIDELRRTLPEVECLVDEGAVLAFHPLLLHASAPARMPAHRRVIHIEFASGELAPSLTWHRRVVP